MAKSQLKIKARALRSMGLSIKNIANELNVSSSTASLWCRDIVLTPDQIKKLEENTKDPYYGRRLAYSMSKQRIRIEKEEYIMTQSKKEIANLSPRERLLAGIALYWAEGFKKDKMVGFANSDPNMIKFVLKWFQESLKISMTQIRLRVGINEYHKERASEIQKYWSNLTAIPPTQFYKPFYQRVAWKKVYEHPEAYYGTLRIRVLKSTDLLRKIKGLISGVQYNIDMAA